MFSFLRWIRSFRFKARWAGQRHVRSRRVRRVARLRVETLEERTVPSTPGAALAGFVNTYYPGTGTALTTATFSQGALIDIGHAPESIAESTSISSPTTPTTAEQQAVNGLGQPAQAPELIVYNSDVPDAQQLITSLMSNSPGRSFGLLELDAKRDSIETLTNFLMQDSTRFGAIAFLGHGADGVVQVGSTYLTTADLNAYQDQLAEWQTSLTAHANLLFYGCDVAETQVGKQLIGDIAGLTGEAVAASTDLTGSSSLGGNWTLEFAVGQINSANLLTPASTSDWAHTLSLFSWPTTPAWTTLSPTPGNTQTVNYSSTGQNISVSIFNSNPGATWNTGYPNTYANGTGVVNGGTTNNGLIYYAKSQATTSGFIQTTINFNYPEGVDNVSFQIWDVDKSAGQFIDTLTNLQATAVGGGVVYPTTLNNTHTSNPGTNYNQITGSGATLKISGLAAASDTTDQGTINVGFSQALDHFPMV